MNRYKYIDEGRQHLHTLDSKALVGVTTAKSIIGGKDNLMQWYADMAAISGLSYPQQDIKAEYEVVQAIVDWKEKSKAKKEFDVKYPNYAEARRAPIRHRDEKAESGSAKHENLEKYIKKCLTENEGRPLEDKDLPVFSFWAIENVKEFIFTEAHCFSEKLWLGGIADFGAILKNGKRVVGDHKSAKAVYSDMWLQTALYDILLAENGILDRDGNKVGDWQVADAYVILPFGSEPFKAEFKTNVSDWRGGALRTVSLYKLLNLDFDNIKDNKAMFESWNKEEKLWNKLLETLKIK